MFTCAEIFRMHFFPFYNFQFKAVYECSNSKAVPTPCLCIQQIAVPSIPDALSPTSRERENTPQLKENTVGREREKQNI